MGGRSWLFTNRGGLFGYKKTAYSFMGGYVDSAEKNQSHNIPHGYTRRLSPSIEI